MLKKDKNENVTTQKMESKSSWVYFWKNVTSTLSFQEESQALGPVFIACDFKIAKNWLNKINLYRSDTFQECITLEISRNVDLPIEDNGIIVII